MGQFQLRQQSSLAVEVSFASSFVRLKADSQHPPGTEQDTNRARPQIDETVLSFSRSSLPQLSFCFLFLFGQPKSRENGRPVQTSAFQSGLSTGQRIYFPVLRPLRYGGRMDREFGDTGPSEGRKSSMIKLTFSDQHGVYSPEFLFPLNQHTQNTHPHVRSRSDQVKSSQISSGQFNSIQETEKSKREMCLKIKSSS